MPAPCLSRALRLPSLRVLPLTGLLLATLGCGRNSDQVPVHPARGQVLFDGRPIPHALLVFHPVGATAGDTPRPRATVQDDGSFRVGTFDGGDGAPAGEYVVTAEWWQIRSKRPEDAELPAVNKLPPRYSRPQSSGVRVQIKEGANQLPPIHLKK